MATIQKRLLALKKKYFLTTSDLGVLLLSDRSTIAAWEKGVTPSPAKLPLIEKKLATLERITSGAKSPFPVPLHVTQYQRKNYLLDAVNVGSSQFSKSGIATGR